MASHVLICGEQGVGKSTLIKKLLDGSDRPVSGLCTKILNTREDGFREFFMFPPFEPEKAVRFAETRQGERRIDSSVFETFGLELLSRCRPGDIILLDELGFMERNSPLFCARVLELLDGDITVLAAVKSTNKDVDFLNRVRSHPNADLYPIDVSNRDSLYDLLRDDPRLK